MMRKLTKKTLYASMALVAGMGLAPAGAQAASYYYSLFELTNINLYGEYIKDMNGNGTYEAGIDQKIWVRSGSNETGNRSATFRAITGASNSAGGADADQDQATFQAHVPPAGTFPVDAPQAYTGSGAAENTFAQSGAAGQYSRADSLITTNSPVMTPFGVFQSGGENSHLVVEGASDSAINYASQSTNTFTGFLDMLDLDFDAIPVDITGDGVPDIGFYDGTNLGWTGRMMLEFDYNYDLQISSDALDPGATASRDMQFNIFREPGTTVNPTPHVLVGQLKAGLGDLNCDVDGDGTYGEDCGTELSNSAAVSLGTDYSEQSAAGAGFRQIFDLTAQKNLGRFYYELSFTQDVAGSAEATIPEPGVLALLGLGLLGLGMARRNRTAA